jgi:Arc/MetJ-type ribon-helix-helix transcriptional regulator
MATTRDIINISLPHDMASDVRREAKAGGYSISEYMRHILREYRKEALARELHVDRKQFEKGKGKVLKSLRALR